jgi:hypothetical protein
MFQDPKASRFVSSFIARGQQVENATVSYNMSSIRGCKKHMSFHVGYLSNFSRLSFDRSVDEIDLFVMGKSTSEILLRYYDFRCHIVQNIAPLLELDACFIQNI